MAMRRSLIRAGWPIGRRVAFLLLPLVAAASMVIVQSATGATSTAVQLAPAVPSQASRVPAGVQTNDVFFTNTTSFTFDGGYVILSTCPDGSCTIVVDDALRLTVGSQSVLLSFYTHDFPPADVTSMFHDGTNPVKIELIDLIGPVRGSPRPFYLVRTATPPPPGTLRIEAAPVGTDSTLADHNGWSRDPINTLTGSFNYQFTDAVIAGRGPSIEFTRTYSSNDTRVGPLGPGWTHSYNTHLASPGAGSADVILVSPEGRSDVYVPTGGGAFRPPPGVQTELVKNADGTYTATHKDQTTWTFDVTGNLVRIGDRFGNLSLLHYDDAGRLTAVDDPAGRGQLTLRYDDARNRLVEVRDWVGRVVSYRYDADNRLSTVTDRAGSPTTFAYEGASQRLTSITDARGNVAVTNSYDGDGRVVTQKDARGLLTGAVTTLSYAAGAGGTKVTTVTYPAAAFEPGWRPQEIDTYDSRGRLIRRTSKPTSNEGEWTTTTYTYNDRFDRTSSTDGDGHSTLFCYDVDYAGAAIAGGRGNLTRRIEPAPQAGAARPVSLFLYDDKNNLIQTVSPGGVNAGDAVGCDTDLRSRLNMAFATDYNYDPATKTRLDSTRQRFTDPVAGLTDAITRYEYGDPANPGQMTRTVPPRGNVGPAPDYIFASTYQYFASGPSAGMLRSATDAGGGTTTYGYDPVGRRTSMVDPIGNAPGGVAADHTWTYSYDNEDRVRVEQSPSPSPGGGSLVTEYRYDAVGNRVATVDPDNRTTRYGFDERDDLAEVRQSAMAADPDTDASSSIVTAYQYDDLDNLQRVARASGRPGEERVTDYRYDGSGRLREETQYPSRPSTAGEFTTVSSFDRRGNQVTMTDPLGQTTTTGYDGLSRPSSITYSDGVTPNVEFLYDVQGNRRSMSDGTGVSSYVYDELDRLLAVTSPSDAGQLTVSYRFDRDGNRISLKYPDGAAVTYTYDSADRLALLQDWAGRKTTYGYLPDGLLATSTNANGTTAEYRYDNARRLTGLINASGANVISQHNYTLDAVGNRRKLAEVLPENGVPKPVSAKRTATTTYDYDKLDRLISETSDQVAATYAYDAVGNRLTLTQGGQVTTYAYDRADRIDTATTTKGNQSTTVDYTTNGAGNLVQRDRDVFQFDQANRLVYSKTRGQVHSVYDGDGKRVSTDVSQGPMATHYYDVNTDLPLLLFDGRRKYVWGLGLEYAVDGNGELEVYHLDGLGSVRAVTTTNGNVAQNYRTDAFGVATQTQGSHNQPFQFAGEERDKETEFYNLRARYYDPSIGRFVSRDPLRMIGNGGYISHGYAYADGDPTNLVDPSGEKPRVLLNFDAKTAWPSATLCPKGLTCHPPQVKTQYQICIATKDGRIDGVQVPFVEHDRDDCSGTPLSAMDALWPPTSWAVASQVGKAYGQATSGKSLGSQLSLACEVLVHAGATIVGGAMRLSINPLDHAIGQYLYDEGETANIGDNKLFCI